MSGGDAGTALMRRARRVRLAARVELPRALKLLATAVEHKFLLQCSRRKAASRRNGWAAWLS